MFADYMEYKKGNGKVLDWYAPFILHTLCASSTVAPRQLFESLEACLGQVPASAGPLSMAVEAKYRLFCESRHLDNRERTFLLDSLQKAKAATEFSQSGQRTQV